MLETNLVSRLSPNHTWRQNVGRKACHIIFLAVALSPKALCLLALLFQCNESYKWGWPRILLNSFSLMAFMFLPKFTWVEGVFYAVRWFDKHSVWSMLRPLVYLEKGGVHLSSMYIVGQSKGASASYAYTHPLVSDLPANTALSKPHQHTNTVELVINHGLYM